MLKLSDRATSEDGVTRLSFWAVGFGGAAESSQKAHTPVSSFPSPRCSQRFNTVNCRRFRGVPGCQ